MVALRSNASSAEIDITTLTQSRLVSVLLGPRRFSVATSPHRPTVGGSALTTDPLHQTLNLTVVLFQRDSSTLDFEVQLVVTVDGSSVSVQTVVDIQPTYFAVDATASWAIPGDNQDDAVGGSSVQASGTCRVGDDA